MAPACSSAAHWAVKAWNSTNWPLRLWWLAWQPFLGAWRGADCDLLMVTEMTGDYNLLVPAALAVMVSYMVESALLPFKDKSLYEAQVLGRGDLPVHRRKKSRRLCACSITSTSTRRPG